MQYLKGNVVFQKGKMTMKCDWARFNKRTENGFLFGNVSMNKEEQNLIADSLFVDSPKDILIAYSNAQVWDSTYSLMLIRCSIFPNLIVDQQMEALYWFKENKQSMGIG